jgi:short-subunit dehydrogenase
MRRTIDGMVVVITGASAGIGKALAVQLSGAGARLVLSARRVDKLEELNRELGGKHLVIGADVGKPEDCDRLIAEAVKWGGRIDTLICNAGYGLVRRVADTSADEMRQIFETNVFGTTDCIRSAIPLMREQEQRDGWKGQIVIVSSAAGRRGLPYFGAYSATKAAQLSLAEALRVELKHDGIAVTSIHPVGTKTDFFTTAEAVSASRLPKRHGIEVQQTAEAVAARIVAGMERPRAEVWPYRVARVALSVATLFPGVVDRALSKRKPRG